MGDAGYICIGQGRQRKWYLMRYQMLESVGGFKYLGIVMYKSDYEWTSLYTNLSKVRDYWVCFRRILVR